MGYFPFVSIGIQIQVRMPVCARHLAIFAACRDKSETSQSIRPINSAARHQLFHRIIRQQESWRFSIAWYTAVIWGDRLL
jgi:hypothetical protein